MLRTLRNCSFIRVIIFIKKSFNTLFLCESLGKDLIRVIIFIKMSFFFLDVDLVEFRPSQLNKKN
jgi:hypothetical protein